MTTATFQVEGMTCNHCANSIQNVLQATSGVQSISVSLADHCVVVQYDQTAVNAQTLSQAIEEAGFDVVGQS
ncbi:heavy-metal-associated domain-containing protein [Moraxella marmotae]|uniref:heavy-metal-associated domain-containing protein n=1 Tax=Moraxella marmotae TaxID=3344520 RepID=UPI0035D3DA9C